MLEKPVEALCEEIQEDASDTRTEESLGHIEEEDITFFDVDLLVEHGIALADIKQLKKSGINTVKGTVMQAYTAWGQSQMQRHLRT